MTPGSRIRPEFTDREECGNVGKQVGPSSDPFRGDEPCPGRSALEGWLTRMLPGVLVPALAIMSACATPPPPAPPPPAPIPAPPSPPVPPPYPFARVYTSAAGATVRQEVGDSSTIEEAFVPLDVLGRDSVGLLVRCQTCTPPVAGRISEDEIVHTAAAPEVAALGSLGEFALAVSTAAEAHDLEALRAVMSPEFFFSFVGVQNPDAAFEVWRSEDFAALDQVPSLLAEGLGTADGKIWAAPREYVESLNYRGLRLGFRKRPDGRWEWLFLIRGIAG
jgi:hypothetical protein